jgi:transcriptional regulator with XRE-family HTH domain
LTREKLAEIANIPDSGTIRRWEKGKEVPKFDRLEVLAKALNVRVRDLFDFGDTEI